MSEFQSNLLGTSSEVKQASKLPLFVAIGLLIFGVGTIPLAFTLETRVLFVFGYVATPVLVLMCVAWDSLSQRSGSKDLWFAVSKKLSFAVRMVAIASFVPAAIQIWHIANWLGEVAVQNGWFQ